MSQLQQPSTNTMPRWVKVSAVMIIILALLVGFMLLSGGHGPGRHAPPSGGNGDQTLPSGNTQHGPGLHAPGGGSGPASTLEPETSLPSTQEP